MVALSWKSHVFTFSYSLWDVYISKTYSVSVFICLRLSFTHSSMACMWLCRSCSRRRVWGGSSWICLGELINTSISYRWLYHVTPKRGALKRGPTCREASQVVSGVCESAIHTLSQEIDDTGNSLQVLHGEQRKLHQLRVLRGGTGWESSGVRGAGQQRWQQHDRVLPQWHPKRAGGETEQETQQTGALQSTQSGGQREREETHHGL